MEMNPTQCKLYLYAPSLPLALVATIIFSILTTVHVLRMTRAGTWSGIYFVFGGVGRFRGPNYDAFYLGSCALEY